jgi:hypothetical protein
LERDLDRFLRFGGDFDFDLEVDSRFFRSAPVLSSSLKGMEEISNMTFQLNSFFQIQTILKKVHFSLLIVNMIFD